MRLYRSRWLDPRRSLRARIGLSFACVALAAALGAALQEGHLSLAIGLAVAVAATGWWIAARMLRPLEDALESRRAELENVIETMAEGLTIVDRDGIFRSVNAASEAIFGVPRSRILGRHVDEMPWRREFPGGQVFTPEQMPFRRIEAGERRLTGFEYDIVRPDGSRVPIALNAARLHDADGSFAGVVATYVDISERRRTEAALRRNEQMKAATLTGALDAVITVDHAGNIMEFNPAAEALFGHARAEIAGKPMVELLIPPRLRARHREGFQRYLATRDSRIIGRRLEMPALQADGTEIEVELSITRLPSTRSTSPRARSTSARAGR
jgi:PAS domain S-box-containing protein